MSQSNTSFPAFPRDSYAFYSSGFLVPTVVGGFSHKKWTHLLILKETRNQFQDDMIVEFILRSLEQITGKEIIMLAVSVHASGLSVTMV